MRDFNGAAAFLRRSDEESENLRALDELLQWGRRISAAERLNDPRFQNLWLLLQWGRRISAAESVEKSATRITDWWMLQWGRGISAAES
ncbi:hypothetical protein WMF29_01440 [Sorangium sp. So ce381]